MKYRIYPKYRLRDLQRKVQQTFAELNACLAGLSIFLWERYFADPTTDPSMLWAEPVPGELHSQGCLAKTLSYLVQSSEMQCEWLLLSFSALVSMALHHLISSISHQRCHRFPYIKCHHPIFYPDHHPGHHDFENILIYPHRHLT